MKFYVKIRPLGSKRFAFASREGGVAFRRAQALEFADRAKAQEHATRLREQDRESRAEVVNWKGRRRPPTITETHPGVEAVARAVSLPEDVVRALARVPGCPIVRGGRGTRFASVEAFKGFLAGLTFEQRMLVTAFAKIEKEKLVEEIARLAWGADSGEVMRLRRRSYVDLVKLRDEWKLRDAEDKERYHPSTVPG